MRQQGEKVEGRIKRAERASKKAELGIKNREARKSQKDELRIMIWTNYLADKRRAILASSRACSSVSLTPAISWRRICSQFLRIPS
jgi:hypothetical protein